MKFTAAPLSGAWVIAVEPHTDSRGFFARTFCVREMEAHGIRFNVAQCSVSVNLANGTLRGMHYQADPHAELKMVQCTRGAIHDVIVDLRPESPTFKKYYGLPLRASDHRMLLVPKGFAHGFLTLEDNTEVSYTMSEFFEPSAARGVRYNDPAFGIEWPAPVLVMSDRDRSYPDFR
jgi:dTDP-4-dehydrorhamnose 3,5-epimerase